MALPLRGWYALYFITTVGILAQSADERHPSPPGFIQDETRTICLIFGICWGAFLQKSFDPFLPIFGKDIAHHCLLPHLVGFCHGHIPLFIISRFAKGQNVWTVLGNTCCQSPGKFPQIFMGYHMVDQSHFFHGVAVYHVPQEQYFQGLFASDGP